MSTRLGASLALLVLTVACAAEAPPPEPVRLSLSIPGDREVDGFVISPDGSRIAYVAEIGGRDHLFVTSARSAEGETFFGDSDGAANPFFSPDSQWVGFFANRRLNIVRADGAEPTESICDAPSGGAGGTWTYDGRIVFAPLNGQGLLEVPAGGGQPRALTQLDKGAGEIAHGWPHALPGGATLFTVSRRGRDAQLAVLPAEGGTPRPLLPATGQAQYVSPGEPGEALFASAGAKIGHLVYGYQGNLLAVPFDLPALATRGAPTVIARNLKSVRGYGDIGRTALSVSRDGALAWMRGSPEESRSVLGWVDRSGALSVVAEIPGQYQSPRLSPDGKYIALVVRSGLTRDIRVVDAVRPGQVLLTLQGGDNHSPAWRPDGRRLTFASNRDGPQDIFEASLDGRVQRLIPTDGSARNPASWSRRPPPMLAFYRVIPDSGRDIQMFRPPDTLTLLVATPANERSPALSEDGRWLAYVSDESGRDEIYVQAIPNPGGPSSIPMARKVSLSGGAEPLWAPDGLLYRDGAAVMLAPFGADEGIVSEPRPLFERRFELDAGGNIPNYDVSRDGQRLLMLKSAVHPREIRIVQNWGTELARTLPR